MKWDTACRPTDYPFYAITWCARASSTPKQYLFSLGSWKKIYFGHSSKKDHHPGLLPQQDFVLLYKFETSWALLGRLSRGFFTLSEASNFKHFKQLFMTLSGLGFLTNVRDFCLPVTVLSWFPMMRPITVIFLAFSQPEIFCALNKNTIYSFHLFVCLFSWMQSPILNPSL